MIRPARMRRAAILFIVAVVVFASATAIFHRATALRLEGGDSQLYSGSYGLTFSEPRLLYHVREPGAVWVFQATHALVRKPGENRLEAVRRSFEWMSAWCGGAFAVLACFHALTQAATRAGRTVTFLLAFAGIYTFVFFGHIELYAPLIAALMLLWLAAGLHFRRGLPAGWVWAAWVLAVTVHRASLFYFPALYFLVPRREGARLRRPNRSFLVAFSCAALGLAIPHILIELGYVASVHGWRIPFSFMPMETYNWLPELLTPLTQTQADYVRANSQLGSFHWFTFGSAGHWKHFGYFLSTAAPLGVPLIVLLGRRLRGDGEKFFAAAAVCGWAWAFVWHPHMSYNDWDLFTHAGLVTNLLAAGLVVRRMEEGSGPPAVSPKAPC